MKTVAFISYKGGTGKTTLAYNMLERAASAGYRVALCDYDPQGTAAGDLAVAGVGPGRWSAAGRAGGANGGQGLIRPGNAGAAGRPALRGLRPGHLRPARGRRVCAEPVVVGGWTCAWCRCRRGPPDLMVAADFAWMAGRLQLPAVFVPSHCAGAGKAPCRHAGGIGVFRAAGLRGGDGQPGLASGRPAARLRGV